MSSTGNVRLFEVQSTATAYPINDATGARTGNATPVTAGATILADLNNVDVVGGNTYVKSGALIRVVTDQSGTLGGQIAESAQTISINQV